MKFDYLPFMRTTPARQVTRPNEAWAIDFAILDFAQRPSVMLVVDVGTGRPLSATVSLVVAEDIVVVLDRLVRRSGSPEQVWMDYSISYNTDQGCFHPSLHDWAKQNRIWLTHDLMLQTRRVSERPLRKLEAFLRDKQFPTLIELGREIERWRQSYTAAPALHSCSFLPRH